MSPRDIHLHINLCHFDSVLGFYYTKEDLQPDSVLFGVQVNMINFLTRLKLLCDSLHNSAEFIQLHGVAWSKAARNSK